MLKSDPSLTAGRAAARPSAACSSSPAAKIDRPGEALEPGAGDARLHRGAASTPAAAGRSGRRASSSAPPSCSSTPPATSASWRSGATRTVAAHGLARHPRRRPRPRVQQRQHLRQPAAADARGPPARGPVGAPLLRARAEGERARCRPRAGRALAPDLGYIYSFNGPHSLFADTIRSLRALAVAHQLGHVLMGEGDRPISLLGRLLQHAEATARFNVYFGEGRDTYDVRGRVAHESIFNVNDGAYRCPSSQQGYSPFTTWTRGLAWILCGYAEQLEFLAALPEAAFEGLGDKAQTLDALPARRPRPPPTSSSRTRRPTACPTGTPARPASRSSATTSAAPAEPFNDHEPVDSSAAAIAAQGLLRLGNYLAARGQAGAGRALPPGRPDGRAHAVRRALPVDRPRPRGAAAALGLPPPQRLGLRARRAARSPAASPHVGRLPRPRARPAHPARGRGRALPQVLPGLIRSSARTRRSGRS